MRASHKERAQFYAFLKTHRTKLENVKLREDLVRQNKKLEEMFELLQKQIQNLARNLDKQASGSGSQNPLFEQ